MPARRPVTRKRQIIALLAIFAFLGLAILGTMVLTQHTGADFGEPCVHGALACKASGFNDARCLMSGAKGTCTRLCADDEPCPAGWRCDYAVWVITGRGDDGNGRVEKMCMREGAAQPSALSSSGRSAPHPDRGGAGR